MTNGGGTESTALVYQGRKTMEKIETLSIDIETYSDIDLKKCGVYKYAASPNFEILLFGYSVNNGPVEVIDIAQGENIPEYILKSLIDDEVVKWAYNCSFERVCLSYWLKKNHPEYFKSYSIEEDTVGNYLDPSAWRCSLVWGAYMGLPLSLKGVGAVLKLDEQKMSEGSDLIRYFCVPCKPTKSNGGRTRNLPGDAPDKWETFKAYNRRDVEVELSIKEKLRNFPVPKFIWDEYHLDQQINDRGIGIDMELVKNAIAFDERSKGTISEQMKGMTDLENPNSVVQMKAWLSENGVETDTLGKKAVDELMKDCPEDISNVLALRQQLAKSSVKKYQAMANAVCDDGRARGMFCFYGANRSGRWAGRLIQLQNLPRNEISDLAEARELVRQGDYESMEMLYDDIPDTLSQLVRTAFIPKSGYQFYVADFSAIEARVIACIAGETWRNELFAVGGDIYSASAQKMFHVPVEKHGVNGHLRQKGKIAELALGYGGSVGALKAMGALEMGLQEEELQPLVDAWRTANPNIVQLWWDVDEAVKTAVKMHITTETHGLKFIWKSGMLFIELPSKRRLCYVKPRIGENRFGGESVTYEGIGATKKWERLESYGPKFVENIVQAISRDLLMNAMKTLSHCFICGHVHDELIIESKPEVSLDELCRQMARVPEWMQGLKLDAAGYVTPWYCKD